MFRLQTPHFRQHDALACNEATDQMILAYYGIKKTQEEIKDACGKIHIGAFYSQFGLSWKEYPKSSVSDVAAFIKDKIDRGYPLKFGYGGHTVLLVGYDATYVYILDPATPWDRRETFKWIADNVIAFQLVTGDQFGLKSKLTAMASQIFALMKDESEVGFIKTGNSYDDSALGFLYAHRCLSKKIADAHDLSLTVDGKLKWGDAGFSHAVLFGGRNSNRITRCYEDNGLTPLKYGGNATNAIIKKQNGTVILNVPLSEISAQNDYFVLEAFDDGPHKLLAAWGIEEAGTYQSGVYFDLQFANLERLNDKSWLIVHWHHPSNFDVIAEE